MTKDREWYDDQYLPSLNIGNAWQIFDSWRQRASAARAKLKFTSDIRYGDHPRELLDFYPATSAPRGCVLFIHGGYWLEFSKIETCWVAKGFVDQGLSVVLLNYPLCPEVTIADIRVSCAKAFAHLYKNVLSDAERARIIVTGHSAGGHLAAAHLVEDWTAHGLPANPITGVMSLSGVFDVAPLIQTSLNDGLLLTEQSAKPLNLIATPPRGTSRLVLAVGEEESQEFHRQSAELAKSWASLSPNLIDLKGNNHFTIVESLAAPGATLNALATQMAQG